MSDSKFWRAVAVMMVAGMFYVGHGLHEGSSDVPSFATPVMASDVTLSENNGYTGVFTASPDGKTIYTWTRSGNTVNYKGAVSAE